MILTYAYLVLGIIMASSSVFSRKRSHRILSALIAILCIFFTYFRFAKNQHDIIAPNFFNFTSWGLTMSRATDFGVGAWLVFVLAVTLTIISCIQFKKFMDRD